jgi:hypothetical protein
MAVVGGWCMAVVCVLCMAVVGVVYGSWCSG